MLDREKVIKGLQIERECVSRDCDRNCGNCDLVQERDWLLSVYDGAIALLKEQEAVEPITDNEGGYWCGSYHEDMVWNQKYCSNCGQAIKWN